MLRTYQFRVYPSDKLEKKLLNTLNICKNTYNKLLETKIKLYKDNKKSMSKFDCNNLIKEWDIVDVHSQVLQNISDRVDNHLKLSKIGHVKIKKHRNIKGIIKTCTIKRNCLGQWFVNLTCEINKENSESNNKKVVGIDVGCTKFATMSNNEIIEHPKYYKQSEKKLKKTHQKYSELKQLPKTNKKKIKTKRKLSKLHVKVANQRKDFLHKESRKIVDKYGVICVEKLNIKSMTKDNFKKLNKSILDSSWNQFRQMLIYKAEEAGKKVVEVDPRNTSKMCSNCGNIVEKKLSDRIHECVCGLKIDRDLNAAINIMRLGTQSLELTIEVTKQV